MAEALGHGVVPTVALAAHTGLAPVRAQALPGAGRPRLTPTGRMHAASRPWLPGAGPPQPDPPRPYACGVPPLAAGDRAPALTPAAPPRPAYGWPSPPPSRPASRAPAPRRDTTSPRREEG